MAELKLPGLRTTPLGAYLGALGLLSATTRLIDPAATGCWRDQTFVLHSVSGSVEDLATRLVARFEPEPVVSPWNQGSGFADNGKSVAAERALAWARGSDDPRLAALRAAITAGDAVLADARVRGWAVEKHKHDVLHLCRNTFPDRAVRWLDAAVALGPDGELAFSRLLGTGGNLGRLDLSSTYAQRCREVLEHRHSRAWLTALLTGATTVALPGVSLGQYDPASAGNPEEHSAAGNPWLFLLLIEGALLFATAVVRRHGSDHTHAALPFQVHSSAAGLDTAAAGETAMAEFWAPEWATPCALSDVEQLLGEGRAQWRNRPARSGLDFARAAATLGVDRGVDAFQRHVFAERLGQSPIAVPAGRVRVSRRDGVDALAGLDPWLDRVQRVSTAGVAAQCRTVEQALFTHARTGAATDLAAVFAAVGACHETVARSGAARRDTAPLVLSQGKALLAALVPALRVDPALRVAVALAATHDPGAATTLGGLRPHLSPVCADRGRPAWTQRPALTALRGGLSTALTEAARRRGFPRADNHTDNHTDNDFADGSAAVRGTRLGFERGPALAAADLTTLATGRFDERRAADLLAGLLTVDWSPLTSPVTSPMTLPMTLTRLPGGGPNDHDPAVDLLVPFTGDGLVTITDADGARTLRLLPDVTWPALLRAGHTDRVLADAAHRIRISGLRHVITPARSALAGPRLASLLLARTTTDTRHAALAHIAVLPTRPQEPSV